MSKRYNMWIKVFAEGLGDMITLLPILKELKKTYVNELGVFVYSTSQYQLLERFKYVDKISLVKEGQDAREQVKDGDFFLDIRDTEIESYWWGSEQFIERYGKMHIYDILQEAVGVKADYENFPHVKCEFKPELQNTVLLGVGGRRKNKLWFNQYWNELTHLLEGEGYRVHTIGATSHKGSHQLKELEEQYGIKRLDTQSLGDTIDALTSASGLITIDSGLMHLSAMQGIPTVSMFGPMPSWLWGPKANHVTNLDGGCGINCATAPLDWECIGRPCMKSITPVKVFNQFQKLKGRDYDETGITPIQSIYR